jgi:hypothetical protein
VARLTCRHCDGALPVRGARCPNCGWAAVYDGDLGIRRSARERIFGIAFIVLVLVVAFTLALATGLLSGGSM